MAVELAVSGEVERLLGGSGWHVVHLDAAQSAGLAHLGRRRRGFVAVQAHLGATTWRSSLMPSGDGRLFVALPAHVRCAEDVEEGDTVTVRVRLDPARHAVGAGPRRW